MNLFLKIVYFALCYYNLIWDINSCWVIFFLIYDDDELCNSIILILLILFLSYSFSFHIILSLVISISLFSSFFLSTSQVTVPGRPSLSIQLMKKSRHCWERKKQFVSEIWSEIKHWASQKWEHTILCSHIHFHSEILMNCNENFFYEHSPNRLSKF